MNVTDPGYPAAADPNSFYNPPVCTCVPELYRAQPVVCCTLLYPEQREAMSLI